MCTSPRIVVRGGRLYRASTDLTSTRWAFGARRDLRELLTSTYRRPENQVKLSGNHAPDRSYTMRNISLVLALWLSLGSAIQTIFQNNLPASDAPAYITVTKIWQMLGPFQLGTRGT